MCRRTNAKLGIGAVMAFVLRLQKSVIWWYAYFTALCNPFVKILISKETKKLLDKMISLVLPFWLLFMWHAFKVITSVY